MRFLRKSRWIEVGFKCCDIGVNFFRKLGRDGRGGTGRWEVFLFCREGSRRR